MQVQDLRKAALGIFDAAVRAVDPGEAIHRHVVRDGNHLRLGQETIDLGAVRQLVVVGLGRHSGQNLLAGMVQLTRRNTRRYGGYIVHFGVIVIMIGFAGSAFNRDIERELGNGDKMQIGAYTLTCRSYTQDDNPNYRSEWAIIDVTKYGKPVATMFPERRFYKASQQMETMVANRSTVKEDLYLVYTGLNQDSGKPIIRAHLNPLVLWIWIGVQIVIAGTIVALVPNLAPAKVVARVPLPLAADAQQPVGAAR